MNDNIGYNMLSPISLTQNLISYTMIYAGRWDSNSIHPRQWSLQMTIIIFNLYSKIICITNMLYKIQIPNTIHIVKF